MYNFVHFYFPFFVHSYFIIYNSKDFKNSNKYDKYLNEGIKSFDKIKSDEELLEKIKNLSDDKVDKIKKFILEVINEE